MEGGMILGVVTDAHGYHRNVYTFDSNDSIKERYAAHRRVHPNACTITHLEGHSFRVAYVGDVLRGYDVDGLLNNIIRITEELYESRTIRRGMTMYTCEDVVLLWLRYQNPTNDAITKRLCESVTSRLTQPIVSERYPEVRLDPTQDLESRYAKSIRPGEVETKLHSLQRFLQNALIRQCDTIEHTFDQLHIDNTVKIDEDVKEYVGIDVHIDFPKGVGILDIFDAMNVYHFIPFAQVVTPTTSYSKIHTSDISMAWFKPLDIEYAEYISFYANTQAMDSYTHPLTIKDCYDGTLRIVERTNDMVKTLLHIKFSHTPRKDGEHNAEVHRLLEQVFENRIAYRPSEITKEGIVTGGCMVFEGVDFSRVAFSDIIATTPLKYILFVKEEYFSGDKVKTSTNKNRYQTYLKAAHHFASKSSVILNIKTHPDSPGKVAVLYTHTNSQKNYLTIERLGEVLRGIFSFYKTHFNAIVRQYATLGHKIEVSKKKALKGKDKKTGDELLKLQQAYPRLFGNPLKDKLSCTTERKRVNNYSGRCGPDGYPTLLRGVDAKREYQSKLRDHRNILIYRNGEYDRSEDWQSTIEDEGVDWFVCKNPTLHPRMIKGRIGGKQIPEAFPCCVKRTEVKGGGVTTHILAPDKVLDPNRYGHPPRAISKLLEFINDKNIYRRVGGLHSPKSFFECMQNVVGLSTSLNAFIKDEKSLSSARQSLYDIPLNKAQAEMIAILESNELYAEPQKWVSVLEDWTRCNIYLVKVDESSPDGDLAIPRHKTSYIPRLFGYDTSIVVIMMKTNENDEEYPYQCEILCQMRSSQKNQFKIGEVIHDSSSPFIKKLDEYFRRKVATLDIPI